MINFVVKAGLGHSIGSIIEVSGENPDHINNALIRDICVAREILDQIITDTLAAQNRRPIGGSYAPNTYGSLVLSVHASPPITNRHEAAEVGIEIYEAWQNTTAQAKNFPPVFDDFLPPTYLRRV